MTSSQWDQKNRSVLLYWRSLIQQKKPLTSVFGHVKIKMLEPGQSVEKQLLTFVVRFILCFIFYDGLTILMFYADSYLNYN